jgi:hypothetical protein
VMKLIQTRLACIVATICCSLFFLFSLGQKVVDTAGKSPHPKNNNIFKFAIGAITRSHSDSADYATVLNTKSETPFLPYKGKIIRHIYVKQYGFEKAFIDTSKISDPNAGSKILNSLHHNTRDWVIRNNLFVREKSYLNPYLVADNERYLRTLEYIQDSRILVSPIADSPDSVDLIVITKDLFSISGAVTNLSFTNSEANISDANVLGMGQKVQFTALLITTNKPAFGYQAQYSKNNIANSFINAGILYSTINNDLYSGAQDEHAKSVTLQRPLFSQFTHLAGAITLGDFESFNNYQLHDSLFYKYHYTTEDAWIGYNLGVRKLGLNSARDRKVVSIRYLHNQFSHTPYQIGNNYLFKFNNRQAVLGSFTFFKQDFYKTNYIYGFGTTEDVPYGYNIAVTGGWYQQSNLNRPYLGVDANWYSVSSKKDFVQYFVRSGAFLNHGQVQDASILVGSSLFSRLFLYKGLKLRQYFNVSYTKQFNRVGIDQLNINNNTFGIRYFTDDSVVGNQRITFHSETSLFLKYKILGFKFSPFTFTDFSLITPEHQDISKANLFYSLGGGIRTRNENFVFGTIELLVAYFPRKATQNESFKIQTNINIQFKYNSNYVTAPDIVQLNTDNNKVY